MVTRGIPHEILLVPDSFKGTHSAAEVAAAVATGLRAGGWECMLCPAADGGEGTLEVLAPALGLRSLSVKARDPLGRMVEAGIGIGPRIAVVEVAAASGLGRVTEDERDAVAASSYGTGELIAAAAAAGAETVYVAAGGSATTDGGSGALRAIRDLGGLSQARLVVLCDVRTPFEQAARVFGPQKGADVDGVRLLSARLARQARSLARDPRGLAYTGAAGGLAGGLWAELDAELVPGAAFVLDALGFDARMRAARAVVTGEGRLDRQSLVGKVVGEVATRARQSGVPCHAVVGSRDLDAFDQRILDLQVVLEASTLDRLRLAGEELAGQL